MKRLTESLGAKIGAVVLCVLLAVVLAVSGVGVVVLAAENAYSDGGEQLRRSLMDSYLWEMGDMAANYYQATVQGYGDSQYYAQRLAADNANYRYTVTDASGNVLLQGEPCDDPQYERTTEYDLSSETESLVETRTFASEQERSDFLGDYLVKHANQAVSFNTAEEIGEAGEIVYSLEITRTFTVRKKVFIHGMIPEKLTAQDSLSTNLYWLNQLLSVRMWLIAVAAAALFGLILVGIFLLCAAGHKAGVEGIHLNWADRIPFDLYGGMLLLLALPPLAIFFEIYNSWAEAIMACVCVVWWFVLLLALVLSFATRSKAGAWWRNTVIFRVLHGGGRAVRWVFRGVLYVLRGLPLVWKTVLVCLAAAFGLFIAILPYDGMERVVLWLLMVAVLGTLALIVAISLRRLQKRVETLAAGEMDSRVDTTYLFGEMRRTAELLNRIGDGMTVAVDARMKSERMKTELITNVSHDIKTPLTSIINYVDLLKKEEPESETMREYLEVLDRQSARLKKLIEDLVEASKASTGNLPVELLPCEAGILLTQMMGEYEERVAAQQLELVLKQPEQPVMILADGRHLSRVFENLMNNICKYSQPATRVYLSLEQIGGRAVITFRNISRAPLNISGDELMERFVRGDSSRNTEGSGLGLSIAKSLTELQGGTLDLTVDGDLFKVTLIFNVCQ